MLVFLDRSVIVINLSVHIIHFMANNKWKWNYNCVVHAYATPCIITIINGSHLLKLFYSSTAWAQIQYISKKYTFFLPKLLNKQVWLTMPNITWIKKTYQDLQPLNALHCWVI